MSNTKKTAFSPGRNPGDGFPKQNGNMKIVKLCIAEIQALRGSGWAWKEVSTFVAQAFNQIELTGGSLQDCHRLALTNEDKAKDGKRRKADRAKRVEKLKEGGVRRISESLMEQVVRYSGDMQSLLQTGQGSDVTRSAIQVSPQPAPAVNATEAASPAKPSSSQTTKKPVLNADQQKVMDGFLLRLSGGHVGREKDYMTVYLIEHYDELQEMEKAKSRDAVYTKLREVLTLFRSNGK